MWNSFCGMLLRMSTASDTAQVIGAIATPLVALAAIGATVWTTRRTLIDKSRERLWSPRVELYGHLLELVDREHRRGDRLSGALIIQPMDLPAAWLDLPIQEPSKWHEDEISVLTFASDSIAKLYLDWIAILGRLRKLAHAADAEISIRDVEEAIKDMHGASDMLFNEMRKELGSGTRHWRLRRYIHKVLR